MKPKEELRLDRQYEQVAQADIEGWENKRGPRPWEESEAMDELRRRRDEREAAAVATVATVATVGAATR